MDTKKVYAITRLGDKSYWTAVGVCYPPNRDGSVNIQLNCVPLSGRLQIRDREAEERQQPEEAA